MKFRLLIACAVLALGACKGGDNAPLNTSLSMATVPACVVGEEYSLTGKPNVFRLDTLTVKDGPRAREYLDHKTPAGEYIVPLYQEVKKGTVERFDGNAEATISFLGVNAAATPDEIPYLTGTGARGNGICRGYARVEKVARNEIRIRVPVRGGVDLGQVSIVLPDAIFEGYPRVLACVSWNIGVHVPYLDKGERKDWPNTSCGLPGNLPGYTLLGERLSQKQRWTLFGAVTDASKK